MEISITPYNNAACKQSFSVFFNILMHLYVTFSPHGIYIYPFTPYSHAGKTPYNKEILVWMERLIYGNDDTLPHNKVQG